MEIISTYLIFLSNIISSFLLLFVTSSLYSEPRPFINSFIILSSGVIPTDIFRSNCYCFTSKNDFVCVVSLWEPSNKNVVEFLLFLTSFFNTFKSISMGIHFIFPLIFTVVKLKIRILILSVRVFPVD